MENKAKEFRDSFIFYKSFSESIQNLPKSKQLELYNAIVQYNFYSEEPDLKGIALAVWILIKPQLDANINRFNAGRKGGRPKKGIDEDDNLEETETKPNDNLEETKPKANGNGNGNVNENNNNNKTIPKGIGEAPFKVNETLKPIEKKNKSDPNINEVINYLKEKVGNLDDTVNWNRRYASNLLRRLKKEYPDKDPVATAKALIDIGLADSFHSKNMTSFRYIFNNQQKILRSYKSNKGGVYILRT